MPFNNNSQLDPSQVQDRRGRGTGRTIAVGGGGIGLILLVVALIFGVNPSDLVNNEIVPSTSNSYSSDIGDLAMDCQTGADANNREDCAIVGFTNSIQSYWADVFAAQGIKYDLSQTVLFSGSTNAACGYASGAMGPFYCPDDQNVYLDLSFFELLRARYGVNDGSFAVAYILAHEYGHHVQNLLGLLDTSGYSSQSMSVFTELQADCLAGVWINNAVETGYLSQVSNEEIADSLNAAAAVGDDRIQSQTQGYVSPETWTHGSSDQRLAALKDGIMTGAANTCETPGW